MKKRKTATILALLTGWLGIHRFYLGQPGIGVVYILLTMFTAGILPIILGLVDAAMFATMKDEIFDLKYNRQPYQRGDRRFERESTRSTRSTRRKQREDRYMDRKREQDREVLRRRTQTTRPTSRTAPKRRAPQVNTSRANPYKQSGVQKFKDYDYDGAITDFHKAIQISPRDVATHFNLACAYSLNENTPESIHHLKQAISFGYNNFDNIRNHDALAFLRIQPEYESFEAAGFEINSAQETQSRPVPETRASEQQAPSAPPPEEDNLLEQLKKLAELRQKGLLTTEQYAVEKRRLLE